MTTLSQRLGVRSAVFVALAFLLPGCETTESRIHEKSAVFATLGPKTQDAIQRGLLAPGYTSEMVYMAIGKPSSIETNANGQETIWTYFNFNTPSGKFFDYAAAPIRTSTQSDILTRNDPGFVAVAGAADLANGELKPQDIVGDGHGNLSQATRRRTAMEMIQSDQRQDLHLKFRGGVLVSYDLEVVSI